MIEALKVLVGGAIGGFLCVLLLGLLGHVLSRRGRRRRETQGNAELAELVRECGRNINVKCERCGQAYTTSELEDGSEVIFTNGCPKCRHPWARKV